MSLKHVPELLELLEFLSDPSPQVRRIALAELLYVMIYTRRNLLTLTFLQQTVYCSREE